MTPPVYFISLARPKRADFFLTMTKEERVVMDDHFTYVRRLFDDRKLVMGGACTDGAFGMLVYRSVSEPDAREIFSKDPLVKAGIAHVEFHPFRIGHFADRL